MQASRTGAGISPFLQLAEQHVDDQSVGAQALHGHVAEFFVRTVHRVAGLEGDHFLPAALGDFVADLDRGAEGIREFGLEIAEAQDLDRAGDNITTG